MRKKVEIKINGIAYPLSVTMGAMLRYKQETGEEFTGIKGISEAIIFLWCCIAASAKKEGLQFDLALMDFADSLGDKEAAEAFDALKEVLGVESAQQVEDEKKSPHP